jgi:hypothetical protein
LVAGLVSVAIVLLGRLKRLEQRELRRIIIDEHGHDEIAASADCGNAKITAAFSDVKR